MRTNKLPPSFLPRLMLLMAAFCGATGASLAARATHSEGGQNLMIVAGFLLVHAPSFLALAALSAHKSLQNIALLVGSCLLFLGIFLFCGDISAKALTKSGFFTYAAPLGGSLLILGWIVIGLSSFFPESSSLLREQDRAPPSRKPFRG